MNLLQKLGALASLMILALGCVQLYRLGLYGGGLAAFCAASLAAFALCLTLYVFHLRARVIALENLLQARQ